MHFDELLARRSSIRAFRPDPVDPRVLERILTAALQSPSWANTQPYRVALATGDRCDALRRDLLDAAATGMPSSDHDMLFDYPPPLRGRRRDTGVGLYGVLGIGRDDHAARAAQYQRNFEFFGAPVVAFLFAHGALGVYSVLDAGVFLQSLLLAATDAGIGACAQASLASHPDVVRRHFDVPPDYRLLCGVSLGHPTDEPVNRFRPPRASLDELLVPTR
jgi:nitroreductase